MVTMRNAFTVALAAACLAVLTTRVPLEFSRIRVRAVTTARPALYDPLVTIHLPDVSRLAGATSAIVVRLRGAAEPARLTIALDGKRLTDVVLPAHDEIRVDTSTTISHAAEHRFVVSGDRTGWELTYLEIANVHGYSRGVFGFSIVPRDLRDIRFFPLWLSIPIAVGLLALRPRPDWPPRAGPRRLYHFGVGVVLALFAIFLITDRFSPYKLLLSFSAFVACTAILYAERTSQLMLWLRRVVLAGRERFQILSTKYSPVLRVWRRVESRAVAVAEIPWLSPTLAATASIIVTLMAVAYGTHVAGGADSYGYVSQSALWAEGLLDIDQPIVKELPDFTNDFLLSPLGWKPKEHERIPGRIVPTYSPGLPLMMTPLRLAFGPSAVFAVVPILAGLGVYLTFLLGRRLDGNATGLFASLWLASSPTFLACSFTPMSDLPVTTAWLGALVAACWPGTLPAALAGLATSLAILTRPNLAPLGTVVALPFLYRLLFDRTSWKRHSRDTAVFLAASAIGPAVVAVLFNYWYGSPLKSGYGTVGGIFSWVHVKANLARYPQWLITSQTVLILSGLVAPFLIPRRKSAGDVVTPAVIGWMLLATCALVWGAYLAYTPFDDWSYLRFVLPSYPPLIVLSSAALLFAVRRTLAPRVLGTVMILVILFGGLDYARRGEVFAQLFGETRYQRVGEYIADNLPGRALLLSMQHSGSLRYYSRQISIRYDQVRVGRLDQLVAYFADRGYPVYFVLDEWEEADFRRLFAAKNVLGKLDWKPIAVLRSSTPVAIYDPRTRGSSTPVRTRIIP
jgi:4-amino-4-deoxy-L-arabinose transferase-like glycosyltransferase